MELLEDDHMDVTTTFISSNTDNIHGTKDSLGLDVKVQGHC